MIQSIYLYGAGVLAAGYGLAILLFDLILRGFAPFIPNRPWVVNQILNELTIPNPTPVFIALSTGRSGLLHALERYYPNATLIGVEQGRFAYIVAKLQSLIRRTRIIVRLEPAHRVDVSRADFIYSHLYPDKMEGLGKKLKFECRSGTIVVSTGFIIPGLQPKRIIDLPDRRGRLDWLSANVRSFQRSKKKYKKEKKAYFYEI